MRTLVTVAEAVVIVGVAALALGATYRMVTGRRSAPRHSNDGDELAERGASAVEYGLLVAAIAAVIVVVVFVLGATVSKAFEHTNSQIGKCVPDPAGADCQTPNGQ